MDTVTELESQILNLERIFWRTAGAKEQAIRDELGLSPTRYYQLLSRLLADPGLVADPLTVQRLRRIARLS